MRAALRRAPVGVGLLKYYRPGGRYRRLLELWDHGCGLSSSITLSSVFAVSVEGEAGEAELGSRDGGDGVAVCLVVRVREEGRRSRWPDVRRLVPLPVHTCGAAWGVGGVDHDRLADHRQVMVDGRANVRVRRRLGDWYRRSH